MKKNIIIALLLTATPVTVWADVRPVTLDDISERVANENYFVRENAEKVYQAKQSIQLARRNLLPRLNLWRLVEAPANPRSLLGIIEDIAPFLVPNNWLRVKEEKLFAQATQHAYRSLWGNQLLTARGLFVQSFLEERLADSIEQNTSDLETIHAIVKTRESLGAMTPGSARQIEVQILSAQEELRTIKRVIHENRSQLAFVLGFPGNDEALPSGVTYMSRSASQNLRYEDLESAVLENSPELKQFDSLIAAAKYVKRERYFSFLGSSSLSRGSGGGVFDGLPQQDGLGFGLAPSIRIVKSQKRILQIQKQAIEETLRKNLKVLIDSYNMDLISRTEADRRVRLTSETLLSLQSRMQLGDTVEALELIQASQARMEALANYHSIEIRLLLNLDRLERMTFSGVFEKKP